MKALLLAAGYGSRLGDLTKDTPKPMLEVAGKPIIEHIITRLHTHGINEIIINLHYLPDIITDYVKDRALYYYEPRLLGHFGTINALRTWLDGSDFFVINGDTISDVDYTRMLNEHRPNRITAYMDEWRCCGSWIYPKEYFSDPNVQVVPYRQPGSVWYDLGTPQRLEEARRYYTQ